MIQSMTGYGKQELVIKNHSFTLEIKTLNSKQLDLGMRLHQSIKSFEMQLRSQVAKSLYRGKVDVTVFYTEGKGDQMPRINMEAGLHYYKELNKLSEVIGEEPQGGLMPLIVRMPEVFDTSEEEWTEKEWKQLEQGMQTALDRVVEFRKQEGEVLEADFRKRIETIVQLLDAVEEFEQERIVRIKEKVKTSLEQLGQDVQYDPNRLEQELIYYIEKLDVTEEKVRLKKHCDYFIEILDNEENAGKKLGFVLQEIGREINTLGSKANDASMQKIVVLMKDELEKIKEQMLNVL
ncbi:MAG: YicC family protein [Bacteroidales bacterium]|nr:YicC family protein [Bacteroidales bacterium]